VDDRDPRRGGERRGLDEQSRLAGTLVAGEDHDAAVPFGETLETVAERGALALAADERDIRRPAPAHTAAEAALARADELEDREIGGLSLQLHAPELAVLEGVAGLCMRLGPDVDPTLRRLRLQTRGDVHRVAQHVELPDHGAVNVPRHHGAGVDADLEVERHGEGEAANVLPHLVSHLDRGARRSVCGLGGAHRVAEDDQEAVAEVLVDRAAVPPSDPVEDSQRTSDCQIGSLGSDPFRELAEADDVGEHHRRPGRPGRRRVRADIVRRVRRR
jgi:hypothetical protein